MSNIPPQLDTHPLSVGAVLMLEPKKPMRSPKAQNTTTIRTMDAKPTPPYHLHKTERTKLQGNKAQLHVSCLLSATIQ